MEESTFHHQWDTGRLMVTSLWRPRSMTIFKKRSPTSYAEIAENKAEIAELRSNQAVMDDQLAALVDQLEDREANR